MKKQSKSLQTLRCAVLLVCIISLGWLANCSSSDPCRGWRWGSRNNSNASNTNSSGPAWNNTTNTSNNTNQSSNRNQNASAAAPSQNSNNPLQGPAAKPSSQIEEADLVRRKGHLLFYMHPHKGFMIFDQKDPKNPKVLSSLRVHGYPVEMFVTDTTAYLLLQKAWQPQQSGHQLEVKASATHRFEIKEMESCLLSIDIRDVSQPRLLQMLPLKGTLRAGAARKQGDIIYVVLHDKNATWQSWGNSQTLWGQLFLRSFNVSDPKQMRQIDVRAMFGNQTLETLHTGIGDFVKASSKAQQQKKDAGPQDATGWKPPAGDRVKILPVAPKLGVVIPERFMGSTITAMNGRLIVTENWLSSASVEVQAEILEQRWERNGTGRCGEPTYEEKFDKVKRTHQIQVKLNFAIVNIFDIASTDGRLKPPIRFRIHGALSDQFKQAYLQHKQGELYLGVIRRHRLKLSENLFWSEVQNAVLSVSLKDSTPRLLQELPFGKPGETVRGSYFDEARQVLYAITATGGDTHSAGTQGGTQGKEDIKDKIPAPTDKPPPTPPAPPRSSFTVLNDPLYAISFQDPGALKEMSAIDGLSGDIHLFRTIGNGQYLLGVGRDTSQDCNGFDESTLSYSRTSVSLFDVRNLSKIRLVQRKCVVTRPDIKVVTSQLNWDRDQAHKQVGLYEKNNHRLLSVPVRFTVQENGQAQPRTAIGLMTWDVSKDQPNRKPSEQNVLRNLGTINHPKGDIQRTVWMEGNAPSPALFLANLSWDYLVNVSLEDPQKPEQLTALSLHPYVEAVYRFGQHLVEQVILDPLAGPLRKTPTPGSRQWNIRTISAAPIESTSPEQSITVHDVTHVIRWKQSLLVFRRLLPKDKAPQHILQVIDFSDPKQPKMTSAIIMEATPLPQQISLDREYPVTKTWFTTTHGLVFLHEPFSSKTYRLFFLDLQQPAQPQLKLLGALTVADATVLRADHNTFFLSATPSEAQSQLKQRLWGWFWQDGKWHERIDAKLPGPLWGVLQDPTTKVWRYVAGVVSKDQVSQIMLLESPEGDTSGKFLWVDSLPLDKLDRSRIHLEGNTLVIRHFNFLDIFSIQNGAIKLKQTLKGEYYKRLWAGMDGTHMFWRYNTTSLLVTKLETSDQSVAQILLWAPNYWWSLDKDDPQRTSYPVTSITWLDQRIFVAAGKLGILEFPWRTSR